jgi:hypothetical protein
MLPVEQDFAPGHPKRFDYDPKSPEAIEWARIHVHPKGERDFPVDHPKALDTPGNTNHLSWAPGVNPLHPELEEHTGATPEQAAGRAAYNKAIAAQAKETPTTDDGRVDTAKIAEQSAVEFVVAQGHSEAEARQIVREQGIDQILAAKATVSGKG